MWVLSLLDAKEPVQVREILNTPAAIRVFVGVCALLHTGDSAHKTETAGSQAERCLRFFQNGANLNLWKQEWRVKLIQDLCKPKNTKFYPMPFFQMEILLYWAMSVCCNNSNSMSSPLNHASKPSGNKTFEHNPVLPCWRQTWFKVKFIQLELFVPV